MDPLEYKDPSIQKSLLELQQRLAGFVKFLINTTITKQGQPASLNLLPWYLMIGPPESGKSSLLHESDLHYVLRKQTQTSSQTVDWWVTKHSCLIDVPGEYLFQTNHFEKSKWGRADQFTRWRYLLHLIRYWRGKQGINGIMIALPIPEYLMSEEKVDYSDLLDNLIARILEIQKKFPHPIPCQLIITKCDLLPGFREFFAEASLEDSENTWGISLPPLKPGDNKENQFNRRFDSLVKRLNDQLLWRLHHEHDANAKLALKDFPLNIEKLRDSLLTFVKKINNGRHSFSLYNIFLTSALQPALAKSDNESVTHSTGLVTTSEQALAIIHSAELPTRGYFIKQLIDQTIIPPSSLPSSGVRKRNTILSLGILVVCTLSLITAFLFTSEDFIKDNDYLLSLHQTVAKHEQAIQMTTNATDRLTLTLDMLNQLQQAADSKLKPNKEWLPLNFIYKNDPQNPANDLYQQALSGLFIQELANYFASYLTTPVNRDIEDVYTGLRSYVMLGYPNSMESNVFISTLQDTLPKTFSDAQRQQLNHHLILALSHNWKAASLSPTRLQTTRHYLDAMPPQKLAYIILKSMNQNAKDKTINLGTNISTSLLVSRAVSNVVPNMFTAHAFLSIYSNEIFTAASEALYGNAVLGNFQHPTDPKEIALLAQQLQSQYVSHYIDIWESLLANIQLTNAADVSQISLDLNQLISNHSPLLTLLETIHANTFFDPIASNSPKLYCLGMLMEKNQESQKQLYQLFYGLSQLHQYVALVEKSPDKNKAAFDLLAVRMKDPNGPNAITQLKLIANDKPEPLKSWLEGIADQTLNLLMVQAGKYMDVSWQQQVNPLYQSKIANHYPFNKTAFNEVDEMSFSHFFGTHGVLANFQREYFLPFIDTSKPEWRWKELNGKPLPFNPEALESIQQAARITHTFFPNGDDKMFVQFTIQPYQVDDIFQQIKLTINDKAFINDPNNPTAPHTFAWPGENQSSNTTIQLLLPNDNVVVQTYPGMWGFFKLINQSYDSVISKKEVVINLSKNKDSAKYAVFTNGPMNPFLSLNLNYFHLPNHVA